LTDQFIQQIKDHIRTDKHSNSVYNVDRVRQSLIKLTDTLFDYIKNNGIKIEFIRASKDNKAGGESMIYPNNAGDGYVIEVNAGSENVYLDILHELLHAVTNPFDN
jgi:Zn-dependent peptidase ImmA (M78 family)